MNPQRRGKLKIFIGYAAGVGKTYQMLEEGQQLKHEGVGVVIGYFEPHGRQDTIARTEGLEIVPRKRIEYRGAVFEEMDTDAILARAPQVCLVDEYAHTNVPGSERAKRWEDVEVLLNAGIDVYTTMNVQHLESLNDQIFQISGVRVRETIPDWVVKQADEVVMTDLTPRALIHRLQRGVVYPGDKALRALENFFRESTLVALRELALRETAHEVQQRGEVAGAPHELAPAAPGQHASNEKILVLVTPDPASAMVLRRARRVADFLDAEVFAVAVQPSGGVSELPQTERDAIATHLNFARNLRIETRIIAADDLATSLVDFARRNSITQIYLARPQERGWTPPFSRGLVEKIVATAKDMQVVVVSSRTR